MSKAITFDECIVCPHQGFSDHEAHCWRTNRAIDCKHETSIPSWCPLPDTQEQGWRDIEKYDLSRQRTRVLTWDGVTVEDCFYGQGSSSRYEDWTKVGWRETKTEKFVRFPITRWMPLPSPPQENKP